MFSPIAKIAIATAGTTAAFIAAAKLEALPGYFMAPPTNAAAGTEANQRAAIQREESQQRVNSFAAGIITGGIVAGVMFAIWRK